MIIMVSTSYSGPRESWVESVMRRFARGLDKMVDSSTLSELKTLAGYAHSAAYIDDYSPSPDGIRLSTLRGKDPRIVDVFLSALQAEDRGWIGSYVKEFREGSAVPAAA
jgi:hypothetical protein